MVTGWAGARFRGTIDTSCKLDAMRGTNDVLGEIFPDEPLPKTTEETPRDYVRTLGITSLGILIWFGVLFLIFQIMVFADVIGLILIVGLIVAGLVGQYRRRR